MRFDVEGGGGARTSRAVAHAPARAAAGRQRPPHAGISRSAPPAWQINGLGFDPNRIDARPRLGSTEIWTFVNHSNRVHPMHLHGFQFRVLERSSAPVEPADKLGWKDTVGVLPNETVTVLAWFAPYAGKYVFHCHALEHADKAMMLQMEVVREALTFTAALAAALACPAAALADATVQAVDGTAPTAPTTAGRRTP